MSSTADEVTAIAHHEGGHAVAALMTADGGVGGGVTVSTVMGVGMPGNGKLCPPLGRPAQAAFIYYAGPWAEARSLWHRPTLVSLDDVDEGWQFRQRVDRAFATSGGGPGGDRFEYDRLSSIAGIVDGGARFSTELESAWPVVQTVAAALQAGLDAAEIEAGPFTELPANSRRKMKRFVLPGPQVTALVQPLLEERGRWRYVR